MIFLLLTNILKSQVKGEYREKNKLVDLKSNKKRAKTFTKKINQKIIAQLKQNKKPLLKNMLYMLK